MERVILHADLNSFYASVECLYRPELKSEPVAVCGDPEQRRGIVLAKNELAKKAGIKTGEAIWEARQKCPGLVVLTPDYEKYLRFSRDARALWGDYTSQVEPFGLDEAWLDVTGSLPLFRQSGRQLADRVRARMRNELGLTCSIGVSFNKVFAKLGSDLKKPDATTVISRADFRERVWPLPVDELLYVGRSTRRRLARIGVRTIGGLAALEPDFLQQYLGKWGLILWTFANGLDTAEVQTGDYRAAIKSIGNSTTTPRDILCEADARIILYVLAESVAARLRDHGMRCATVQISIRDFRMFSIERQMPLARATDLASEIVAAAMALFRANFDGRTAIRSLGVRGTDLVSADGRIQMSLLCDEQALMRQRDLERTLDVIRRRYGYFSVQRGLMLADQALSGFNPREEHVIHPVGYTLD